MESEEVIVVSAPAKKSREWNQCALGSTAATTVVLKHFTSSAFIHFCFYPLTKRILSTQAPPLPLPPPTPTVSFPGNPTKHSHWFDQTFSLRRLLYLYIFIFSLFNAFCLRLSAWDRHSFRFPFLSCFSISEPEAKKKKVKTKSVFV